MTSRSKLGLLRNQKSGKDAGEWLPDRNQCWFAERVLDVKRAYGLTVDRREGRRSNGSFAGARARRWSPWCAGRRRRQLETLDGARPTGTTPSRGTTTTEMAGSHARRPGGTASRPSLGRIQRTGTCGTETATELCASEQRRRIRTDIRDRNLSRTAWQDPNKSRQRESIA